MEESARGRWDAKVGEALKRVRRVWYDLSLGIQAEARSLKDQEV